MIFKVLAAELLRQKMSRLQDFERYMFCLSRYMEYNPNRLTFVSSLGTCHILPGWQM